MAPEDAIIAVAMIMDKCLDMVTSLAPTAVE